MLLWFTYLDGILLSGWTLPDAAGIQTQICISYALHSLSALRY